MENLNNLALTLLKATLLATIIFWMFIFSKESFPEAYILLIIIASIIPIFIVCTFTILITIMPFFWLEQNNLSEGEIFKKYFPYYSIVAFCVFLYFMISTNFDDFVCAFSISAFFTLMQTWVWIGKNSSIKKKLKIS